MVRELKSKYFVVYEHILDEINVGQCGITVKVTTALVKFIHLIFCLIFLSPADGSSMQTVKEVTAEDTA